MASGCLTAPPLPRGMTTRLAAGTEGDRYKRLSYYIEPSRKWVRAVDTVRWEVKVRADPMELTAKLTK